MNTQLLVESEPSSGSVQLLVDSESSLGSPQVRAPICCGDFLAFDRALQIYKTKRKTCQRGAGVPPPMPKSEIFSIQNG